MNKEIFHKAWFLTVLLLLIDIVLVGITFLVFSLFKIPLSSAMGIATIVVSAGILGQFYSYKFKQIMPKKLRFRIVIYFAIIQIIALILLSLLDPVPFTLGVWFIMIIAGIILLSLESLGLYFLLASPGEKNLKMILENQKNASKK